MRLSEGERKVASVSQTSAAEWLMLVTGRVAELSRGLKAAYKDLTYIIPAIASLQLVELPCQKQLHALQMTAGVEELLI